MHRENVFTFKAYQTKPNKAVLKNLNTIKHIQTEQDNLVFI